MKKKWIVIVICTIMLFGNTTYAVETSQEDPFKNQSTVRIKVVDGGCEDEICGEGYNVSGTTYVPIRIVMEAMGADVKWDGTNNTVVIKKGQEEDPKHTMELENLYNQYKDEMNMLLIVERQLNLAHEAYEELNETDWIQQLRKGILIERKQAISVLTEKVIQFQKEHEGKDQQIEALTALTNNLNTIISYFELSAQSLERYAQSNQKGDYKNYILHRKLAVDLIASSMEIIDHTQKKLKK